MSDKPKETTLGRSVMADLAINTANRPKGWTGYFQLLIFSNDEFELAFQGSIGTVTTLDSMEAVGCSRRCWVMPINCPAPMIGARK